MVRKLSYPALEAVRPKAADPLDERIFGARMNVEKVPWLKAHQVPTPDFRSAMAIYRIGRMINENFSNMGEYIATMMGEFEDPKSCSIFLMRKKGEPAVLEHRLTIGRLNDGFTIDESMDPPISEDLKARIISAFESKKPTVFDGGLKVKMAFENLDMNDYTCRFEPLSEEELAISGGSLAIMPFYYRDPVNPSGVVVFEGDLRCRGTALGGVDATFWTATVAMEAASQVSFMLTHKFDAITILTRVQDFQADFKLGVRQLIKNQIENMYMVMLDLDDFKAVNTRFGWHGGNEVLKKVSEIIKKSVRLDDTVSRIGGEEFGVILRDVVSKREAEAIAERIRRNVADLRIMIDGIEARVTVSIGITRVDRVAQRSLVAGGVAHLDNAVLENLYNQILKFSEEGVSSAKRSGKNTVCYHGAA
ncbi:MAG: GGDEF domain-containing protein [Candidatus Micrarchaeia archaeon]